MMPVLGGSALHLNSKSKDQFELLLPPTLNFITKEFFLGHLFISVLLFELRKENVLDQQVYQPVKLKVFASFSVTLLYTLNLCLPS